MKYKTIHLEEGDFKTTLSKTYLNRKKYITKDPSELKAVIPGIIRKIYVKKNQEINIGDDLFIIESMKMRNIVKSDVKGTIESINVKVGEQVTKDQLIIKLST